MRRQVRWGWRTTWQFSRLLRIRFWRLMDAYIIKKFGHFRGKVGSWCYIFQDYELFFEVSRLVKPLMLHFSSFPRNKTDGNNSKFMRSKQWPFFSSPLLSCEGRRNYLLCGGTSILEPFDLQKKLSRKKVKCESTLFRPQCVKLTNIAISYFARYTFLRKG